MNFFAGVIFGFVIGLILWVICDTHDEDNLFKKAAVEHRLNLACDNAYNLGRLEEKRKKDILIERICTDIETQIQRDFKYSEIETVKVPCHYGIANGLQCALKTIDNHVKAEGEEDGRSNKEKAGR